MKMKYKDFEWSVNPFDVKVVSSTNLNISPVFGKKSVSENVSINPTVVEGKGVFYGENGRERCSFLQHLLKLTDSGWLFISGAPPIRAFFIRFSFTNNSEKNCFSYEFKFVEDCSEKREERILSFIYAEEGENAFDIAYRCGVSVDDIMKNNDIKTPFDIAEGQKVAIR